MTTWFVAAQNPGTSSFLDASLVAVNFWVRTPVHGLDADAIKARASGRHEEWDRKTAAIKTGFARQLSLFANDIAVDDTVLSFDAVRPDLVVVGRIISGYRYEDPPTIPDHPHVRDVEWLGTTTRTEVPDAGAALRHTRGVTVRRIAESTAVATSALEDAPAAPAPAHRTHHAEPRPADSFRFEPPTGSHRHILWQTFGRSGEAGRPLVVVMLNPAANTLPGFRRSRTCHAVRAWGEAHGYDSAAYINLFTFIEPNSARLAAVPYRALNTPESDDAIRAMTSEIDTTVVAGWGNLPPGFQRPVYDDRVRQIEQLIGRPMKCMGLTQSGYPRHGRGWRPDDNLLPLPGPLTTPRTLASESHLMQT